MGRKWVAFVFLRRWFVVCCSKLGFRVGGILLNFVFYVILVGFGTVSVVYVKLKLSRVLVFFFIVGG